MRRALSAKTFLPNGALISAASHMQSGNVASQAKHASGMYVQKVNGGGKRIVRMLPGAAGSR
jgi:hypothetical protein